MRLAWPTKTALLTAAAFAVAACQPTNPSASAGVPSLSVAFADPSWNGKTIPAGQQCKKFGGNGATPALRVSGIPRDANAIVVEFNDLSYAPLATNGGHGKIGFWVSGEVATLPAVPGGTNEMPAGVFLDAQNRATGAWASAGYLPPCSGGSGNLYVAEVKAIYKPTKAGEQGKLLAIGKIDLGRY